VSFSFRVLFLGLVVYVFPRLFRTLTAKWFGESYEEQATILRNRFWKSFLLVVCVLGSVLFVQWARGYLHLYSETLIRIVAAVLAPTAALGRGGWQIQTWKGQTLVERIDRGMYKLTQLGAAALLIFVLTL
jgi:hypothetical protein